MSLWIRSRDSNGREMHRVISSDRGWWDAASVMPINYKEMIESDRYPIPPSQCNTRVINELLVRKPRKQ